jgi:acylphosphatase
VTAVRYLVRGRVQGVGFRWFASSAAARLGLRGWVRNLADGSVEVVAAGAPDALASLERSLRNGPPAGRVSEVEVAPATAPSEAGFEIR